MKENFLNVGYWRARTLLPTQSNTDFYYVNLARKLYGTIRASQMGRLSDAMWVANTAMAISAYMEDMVSGFGLWRAFVRKHKALHGKYLPFYEVDEARYYLDEINVEDVRFLLWGSVQRTKPEGSFVNPENPYLLELADEVYKVLDREFEKAPINEEKKEEICKLVDSGNSDNYFTLMDFLLRSLLLNDDYQQVGDRALADVKDLLRKDMQQTTVEWMVKTQSTFHVNRGMLALNGPEWLGAFFRELGKDEAARKVEEMDNLPLSYYLMKSYDDTTVVLESVDGNEYQVSRKDFEPMVEQLMSINKVCLAQLICFDGVWKVNGSSSWFTDEKIFADYKMACDLKAKMRRTLYDKVMEANGDNPLVYFQDTDALNGWFNEALQFPPVNMGKESSQYAKSIAFFVKPDKDPDIMPMFATALKDPRNPFYQPSVAGERQLRILCAPSLGSAEFLHYMLEHGMLADAALTSAEKGQDGKKLVQDNLDSIARFMRPAFY